MFPSRCTIKTRAMSIYRKLAASSRSQAVARSRELEDRVRAACEALGLRYGVYTDATPQHERARMQDNPPDILLTNYSMLEFILTRREDRKLFGAGVLRHLARVSDDHAPCQGVLPGRDGFTGPPGPMT